MHADTDILNDLLGHVIGWAFTTRTACRQPLRLCSRPRVEIKGAVHGL